MKKLSLVVFLGVVVGLGFRVYAEPQQARPQQAQPQQAQRVPAATQAPAMAVGHTTASLH